MDLKSKKKAIKEVIIKQSKLIIEYLEKLDTDNEMNDFEFLAIMRMLEMRKYIIASQPIKPMNFPKGGYIGENGKEVIINKSNKN